MDNKVIRSFMTSSTNFFTIMGEVVFQAVTKYIHRKINSEMSENGCFDFSFRLFYDKESGYFEFSELSEERKE